MPIIANFRRVQVEESKVQGHPQLYSRLEVNLRYICPCVGGKKSLRTSKKVQWVEALVKSEDLSSVSNGRREN